MASGPIISLQIEGSKVKAVTYCLFLDSKISEDCDCSHEIRWWLLLGRKAMTNLDSVLKSKDITLLTKVHTVKAMVFPIVMYGCESWTIKKAECWRIDAFKLWCWEDSWESFGQQEDQTNNIKGNQALEGLMLKVKLQYFGHLMPTADSLEKTLMLGRIEGSRRGGWQGWDGWMTSPIQCTWTWANLGRWWETWKPGMLQSTESVRVRHDLATEQQCNI